MGVVAFEAPEEHPERCFGWGVGYQRHAGGTGRADIGRDRRRASTPGDNSTVGVQAVVADRAAQAQGVEETLATAMIAKSLPVA